MPLVLSEHFLLWYFSVPHGFILLAWIGSVVFIVDKGFGYGYGEETLSDLHGASPVLMGIGHWDIVLCVWAVFAIFVILAIYMARSKNTGKGKAPSSSMESALKKRKADTSQTIKKGKGKRRDSSSESEEALESKDEEIEAMFVKASDSEQDKWAQSISKRGFHCEQGVKVDTFLFTHPIGAIIQEQNL